MDEEKTSVGEVRTIIERRFQFVIILGLFLPSVWDKVGEIISIIPSPFDSKIMLGTIITAIFLGYVSIEVVNDMSKKILSDKNLQAIGLMLLVLSYGLVAMIGTVSIYTPAELVGWKELGIYLTALTVLGLSILIPVVAVYLMFKSAWLFVWKKIVRK